jgi:hypothetical protein
MENIAVVRMQTVDLFADLQDALDETEAETEEEKEMEVLQFAAVACHSSPYAKALRELHDLNFSYLPEECARFFNKAHMTADCPYCDSKTQIQFFINIGCSRSPYNLDHQKRLRETK